MNIILAKYNTKDYEINITGFDGEISKLLFTVEDVSKNTIFKKELNNGIVKVNDGQYVLSIEAQDTKNMNENYTYTYYIEVIIDSPYYVETMQTGNFELTKSSNELGSEING